jgi:peptide/nickel transport system permease protein
MSAPAEAISVPLDAPAKAKEQHPIRTMLLHRLAFGVVTIVAIAIIVYFATTVLPGDAATSILGQSATPQKLTSLRHELGLDKPLLTRFANWAGNAVQGDFGASLTYAPRSVTSLILPRMANSAVLLLIAAVVSSVLGVLLGTYAAFRRDGPFDTIFSALSLAASALPEFVVSIFVVMLLSVNVLHIFPGVSILQPGEHIWNEPEKAVLPALALVIVCTPYIFRMMRASMIEALNSDYVEMARLKGVSARRIALRHAFPNALPPVIQVIGLVVLYLAGGIVLVETVFGFPGVGSSLVQAVSSRDVPVIQFTVLALAVFYVVLNSLTDVAVLLVPPRKRYPR